MRKFLFFIWIVCCSLLTTNSDRVWAGTSITVKDMAGREVVVPHDPARIICLSPGTLRLIMYLQAGDKVVGIEDIEKKFPDTRPYYLAHPELGRLPSIGPGGPNSINKEPDLEKVLSIKPDVIFITYLDRDKADSLHKKIGIPVIVLTYGPFGTFDETVYDSIRVAGRVLNKEERAEQIVNFIEAARKDLLARVKGYPVEKKPAVYVGALGFKGTHGLESTATLYAPFDWVEARNAVTSKAGQTNLFIGKEELLSLNPDVVFIDGGGRHLVKQDFDKKPEFYLGLKAFQQKRVYTLYPFNWYMTNLGTVIADAYTVGKIIFPERFADVDLEGKADEVYRFLIGRPVYEKMIQVHGRLGEIPSFLKD